MCIGYILDSYYCKQHTDFICEWPPPELLIKSIRLPSITCLLSYDRNNDICNIPFASRGLSRAAQSPSSIYLLYTSLRDTSRDSSCFEMLYKVLRQTVPVGEWSYGLGWHDSSIEPSSLSVPVLCRLTNGFYGYIKTVCDWLLVTLDNNHGDFRPAGPWGKCRCKPLVIQDEFYK